MERFSDSEATRAHRYYSAHCFNSAWELIRKQDRTPLEDLLMATMSQASLYHWIHRPDCTDRNLSIGYWQASRVHSLLGIAHEAKRFAEICREFSGELDPFYQGYAEEALARAEWVAGNLDAARAHARKASAHAEAVKEADDRARLLQDLALFLDSPA